MSITTDGHCPQCRLTGENYIVVLNTMDYWECPKCSLQMQMLTEEHLGILPERGNGNLIKTTSYHYEKWGDRILIKKPIFLFDTSHIENEKELNIYLQDIL